MDRIHCLARKGKENEGIYMVTLRNSYSPLAGSELNGAMEVKVEKLRRAGTVETIFYAHIN